MRAASSIGSTGSTPDESSDSDFVLVDFDGTLAECDVGNRFFHRFARRESEWLEIVEDWKQERATARECLARECDVARVDEAEALEFFDGFSLAADAADFVVAGRRAGHRLEIASDGVEIYIARLLAGAGLEILFSANRVAFGDGTLIPEFACRGPEAAMRRGRVARSRPQAGPGCGRCGNCKGAILTAVRRRGGVRRTILVGDGYSDRCAAEVADVVYAKDDLLSYCRQRGKAVRAFRTLRDVAVAEAWPWPGARDGESAVL